MAKTLKVQLAEAKATITAQDVQIKDLEHARDAALADASPADAAQDAKIAELEAEVDEASEIQHSLEAEVAAFKAAAPSPFVSAGSVNADGLLFLGGRAFSEGWRSEHATQSIWYIDFEGADAERVARVARGAGTVSQLGPNLWRTTQPNSQYATITVNQVRTNIAQQELKCSVVGYPMNCSRAQGLDASRLTGIGAAVGGAIAVRAKSVSVSAKYDADGKATELLLKL